MKSHYTFTACILRNGQDKRLVPNCATEDGYLLIKSGKGFRPCFDSEKIKAAGKQNSDFQSYDTIEQVKAAGLESFLLKFGKQDGYWIWNHEVAEKKKVEVAKTVKVFVKKDDPYDYDEDDYRCPKNAAYPSAVKEIIARHTSEPRYGHPEITNYAKLKAEIEAIGWKLSM